MTWQIAQDKWPGFLKQRSTVENRKAEQTKTGRGNAEQVLVTYIEKTPFESQFNDKNCKNKQEEGRGGGGGQTSSDLSTD